MRALEGEGCQADGGSLVLGGQLLPLGFLDLLCCPNHLTAAAVPAAAAAAAAD
jgi:hypothetical protein